MLQCEKMKDFARKFYNSDRWKKARAKFISDRINKDGGLCEICRESPGFIVHHKKVLTAANINDPDITLNPKNLSFVCKDCHDRLEGHWLDRKYHINMKVSFDCDGEPLPPIV